MASFSRDSSSSIPNQASPISIHSFTNSSNQTFDFHSSISQPSYLRHLDSACSHSSFIVDIAAPGRFDISCLRFRVSSTHHLSSADLSSQVQSATIDYLGIQVTDCLFLPPSVPQQRLICVVATLIHQFSDLSLDMLNHFSSCSVVSVDTEGHNLVDRSPDIVQLCTCRYCLVLKLSPADPKLIHFLKTLFNEETILKVIHDVSMDVVSLFRLNIRLRSVFDTSLAWVLSGHRLSNWSSAASERRSLRLNDLLSLYDLPLSPLRDRGPSSRCASSNRCWLNLTPDLFARAAFDVCVLSALHTAMRSTFPTFELNKVIVESDRLCRCLATADQYHFYPSTPLSIERILKLHQLPCRISRDTDPGFTDIRSRKVTIFVAKGISKEFIISVAKGIRNLDVKEIQKVWHQAESEKDERPNKFYQFRSNALSLITLNAVSLGLFALLFLVTYLSAHVLSFHQETAHNDSATRATLGTMSPRQACSILSDANGN